MSDFDNYQDAQITKLARKQPDVALGLAEDLVKRFPSVSRSWSSLAYVQTILRDYVGALNSLNSALLIDSEEPAHLFHISRIYIKASMHEMAIKSLSKCIEVSTIIGNTYYIEACHFHRSFCYCIIGDFERAEFDLDYINDDRPLWIDRLLSKADLEVACRRKRLD